MAVTDDRKYTKAFVYNLLEGVKGISITGVTFEPDIQRDFMTSHFWSISKAFLNMYTLI